MLGGESRRQRSQWLAIRRGLSRRLVSSTLPPAHLRTAAIRTLARREVHSARQPVVLGLISDNSAVSRLRWVSSWSTDRRGPATF